MPKPTLAPRVLVVLDTSMAWSRGVLRGLSDFSRAKGWDLLRYHAPGSLRWLVEVWRPEVLVLQHGVHGDLGEVRRSCALVSVNSGLGDGVMASVSLDERAIGQLGARHLLERGLRNLSAFRFNSGAFAEARERGFAEAARAGGARLVPGWWRDDAVPPSHHENPAALTAWLAELPRPCGVFAATDSWARVVARYARVAGLRVPEDLALIGVDDDRVECELEVPPLSSVAIPWRSMGEKAGQLAARALAAHPGAGERIVLEPLDVVPRRSTDVTVVHDPIVERAMGWIAQRSRDRLTLNAIARAASCSRQRLEQRFRAAIGRTVMQEVRRARVDIAKRLLSTTSLPLEQVAEQSGFTSATMLSVVFRRETGTPPGGYRRRFRGKDSRDE